MGAEDLRALLLREIRGFKSFEIEEFAAIVSGDGLEDPAEVPGAIVSLNAPDRLQNTGLCFVGDFTNNDTPVLTFNQG